MVAFPRPKLRFTSRARQFHFALPQGAGKRQPDGTALELGFRRVCDGANFTGQSLNDPMISAEKQVNSTGLQLVDLTARPIGRHVMNPIQSNRDYGMILTKLDRSKSGEVSGYGLESYR